MQKILEQISQVSNTDAAVLIFGEIGTGKELVARSIHKNSSRKNKQLVKGPNPVEFILHGLAGCLSTTFVYYAAAEGVEIDEIDYTLEGDIDIRGLLGISKKVRPGYQNIRVIFHVKSDAPTEKLQELVRLAQMRSPVFNTVSEPVPVDVGLEVAQPVA